jgi:DTW domain-containing protein YfiP
LDLEKYLVLRQTLRAQETQFRELCHSCLQPSFGCYCELIQKFDPQIEFVILIHPLEVRKRIATGRMTHLCLKNSYLVHGQDFSKNPGVNRLLADPTKQCVLLYPGANSLNLSEKKETLTSFFPLQKKLVIFVVDGTWHTAKKMLRLSENLHGLPRICFTPSRPSQFRVRKQPAPHCFSTIEAVHQMIEMLGPSRGFDLGSRLHDNMLTVFDALVERQLDFIRQSQADPSFSNYRNRKA